MVETEPRKLEIELYHVGELDPAAAGKLSAHLETCAACSEYLESLQKVAREFLSEHPFSEFARSNLADARAPWYRRVLDALMRPALVPAFAALLLAVVAVPVLMRQAASRSSDAIRYKGQASLSFQYRRDGVVSEGNLDGEYRAGDEIQVVYSSERDMYLTLISIDSRGQVSFYHAESQSQVCSIRSGTGNSLRYPVSIRLDNSSGHELVVAVFSETAMETFAVQAWSANYLGQTGGVKDLERVLRRNPPVAGSRVLTLLLRKANAR